MTLESIAVTFFFVFALQTIVQREDIRNYAADARSLRQALVGTAGRKQFLQGVIDMGQDALLDAL